MCIRPFRNVPLASTTDFARKVTPRLVMTPATRLWPSSPVSINSSLTSSCHIERWSVCSRIPRHSAENFIRSHCARGLHIAGPFERLSIRNWMEARSVTIPIRPPNASISRTICPLAMPPTAGLQLIWAILLRSMVISRVSAPRRAAAAAASQPAWPAPTTITSKSKIMLPPPFLMSFPEKPYHRAAKGPHPHGLP